MDHINLSNGRNFKAPYVFSEYPKWVTKTDGSSALVNSADEEVEASDDAPQSNERDALMAQAKALGLNPHHKTGVEKLKGLIATQTQSQSE
jgi:hypothetical protein